MTNIAMGTPTLDNSRKVITVPITSATGALTLGATPDITAEVNNVPVSTASVAAAGSGATAKLIVTLAAVAPVGKSVKVVAAGGTSIVDASSHALTAATVTATDPQTTNQSALQAMIQAGIQNHSFYQQIANGLFGKVETHGDGVFTVYNQDNSTKIAEFRGEVDTAGNLNVHSWRQLPVQ